MKSTYAITTDNEFMKAIGLSYFTFSSLEKWLEDESNMEYISGFNLVETTTKTKISHILYDNPPGTEGTNIKLKAKRNDPQEPFVEYTYVSSYKSGWEKELLRASNLELGTLVPTEQPGYKDDKAYRIVYMNNKINYTAYDTSDATEIARSVFIQDIFDAGGFVTWDNTIGFKIDGSSDICYQKVTFKLHIHDSITPKESPVKIGLNNPVIVQTENPVDEEGNRGESTEVPRRLIPGSPIKYVKMKDSISPRTDVDQDVPTGEAYLMEFRGGNEFALGEVYKPCSEQVETDSEEENFETVTIHNNTPFSFKKDAITPAFKIYNDGKELWQPLMSDTSEETPDTIQPSVDSWAFTYLVTNCQHFFRGRGNTYITYADYERAVDHMYYNTWLDDNNVPSEDYTVLPLEKYGYMQLTSFDFMGKNVGGLRETHALSSTQLGERANGEVDTVLGDLRNGLTAPFFGCVFPGGYNQDKWEQTTVKEYKSTDPVYINTIPTDTTLFDSNDEHNGHVNGHIFEQGLKQLPADIALNANPYSTNGSPVQKMFELQKHFHIDNYINAFQGSDFDADAIKRTINKFLTDQENLRYVWLKSDDTEDAFDISPVSKGVIQFRPLRTETYASFEVAQESDLDLVGINGTGSTLGYFGKTAWSFLSSPTEPPISRYAITRMLRESDEKIENVQETIVTNGIDNQEEYGIISRTLSRPLNPNYCYLKYNKDLILNANLPSPEAPMPVDYWNNQFGRDWLASGPRPAGGIGIIGAKCTVSANSKIKFNTNYIYGMDDTFGGYNQLTGTQWIQAFGGGSDYRQLNTTTLHVRVFQNWPDHLTVYDPRFFSIFHFNYGASARDAEYNPIEYWEYYNEGVQVSEKEFNEGEEKGYPDKYYKIETPGATADGSESLLDKSDFRVPTYFQSNAVEGDGVPKGLLIYEDKVSDGYGKEIGEMLPYEYWHLDKQSRGKLLPFEGKRNTIGIGDIVTNERGKDYKESDTFYIEDQYGENVELDVEVDDEGGCNKFIVTNPGNGFRPSSFFKKGDEQSYGPAKLKIKVTTETGTGLEAWVKYGVVREYNYEIPKPSPANDGQELSKLLKDPPSAGIEPDQTKASVGPGDTVTIDIQNISDNKKYDCFFFYKNDISHVFSDQHWAPSPVCNEQYVELAITSE